MRPLTDRQKAALKRLYRDPAHREHFSPDLAKQLHKRGVAELTGYKHTRYEWQRPVATLWEVRLTAAGRNLFGVLCPGKFLWDRSLVNERVYDADSSAGRIRAIDSPPGDPRWLVTLYTHDGREYRSVGNDRDECAAEVLDIARLDAERRAAINAVESRY